MSSTTTSVQSPLTPNPTTPSYSNDLDWITAYLTIHCSSNPSTVYAYILWVAIAVVLVIYALFHLAGLRARVLGAYFTKWSLRRRTWRKKHSLAEAKRKGLPYKPPLPFPSNAQLLALSVLIIATMLLSFVGPDYIAPNSTIFGLGTPTTTTPATKREIPPADNLAPQYTIQKAWWTSSNRTGIVAFALFPLCVLFALKAPPFAIFALPFVLQIHFDKLAWLHRWSGRLIWFVTTLHVVFWSVQLFEDRRDGTGKIAYTYAWDFQRFIFAWTAYGLMTLLVILSIKPIRQAHYEAFYFMHVILIPMTIVMSALHHPQVWWWCGAALYLWFGERIWRGAWWLHTNGFFGSVQPPVPTVSLGPPAKSGAGAEESSQYPPPLSVPHLLVPERYIPPPGFALAELLPGRTVRLRLITPGYLPWAPGQHFLLGIPSICRFTTHPFTVASVCDEQSPTDEGRELDFIVRAKNGWSKDLWDALALAVSRGQSSISGENLPGSYPLPRRGVLMRAYVDGPFGSAERARWGAHSTVLLVTGGSGVCFGLSVLQYLCLCLAGRDGSHLGGHKGGWGKPGFRTTRVRFVWLVREFGHIQWGASILRRCMAMVPSAELQVEIFVTNVAPAPQSGPAAIASFTSQALPMKDDNLTMPIPDFARALGKQQSRSASPDDDDGMESDTWVDNMDLSYYSGDYVRDNDELGHEEHVLDLTNFEGDNDTAIPGEHVFSLSIKREGRLRRANTRRQSMIQGTQGAKQRQLGMRVDTGWNQSMVNMADSRTHLSPLEYGSDGSPSSALRSPNSAAPLLNHEHPMSGLRSPVSPPHESSSHRPRRDSAVSQMSDTRSLAALVTKESEQLQHDLDAQEMEDVGVVAEHARPGKPRLDRILADEVERAKGSIIVGCCGPTSLNAMMRKAIAAQIDPARIARGDMRGLISMISEDFEY
ncbi:hypothetical protein SCP_0405330 [Sparassis crispa]|uniref:ferric-chelate reductase (NADPH) n=1 Tax=Sparassis crispa TaxID=139825 RepID=A0A401GJ49_9APHY|nr:hypothetical protein SCP_0405330 [Sparassis crispa]GBE82153.1 hypothetical protein SCP_0405330 [Sparassis crispa]